MGGRGVKGWGMWGEWGRGGDATWSNLLPLCWVRQTLTPEALQAANPGAHNCLHVQVLPLLRGNR